MEIRENKNPDFFFGGGYNSYFIYIHSLFISLIICTLSRRHSYGIRFFPGNKNEMLTLPFYR